MDSNIFHRSPEREAHELRRRSKDCPIDKQDILILALSVLLLMLAVFMGIRAIAVDLFEQANRGQGKGWEARQHSPGMLADTNRKLDIVFSQSSMCIVVANPYSGAVSVPPVAR